MNSLEPVKAYIIHTPHLDRSETLRFQLTSLGIKYEMIESLSYWLNQEELKLLHKGSDFYKVTIGRDLSLAEIGGSYGHQLAYQSMVKNGVPWGLIFEDDARLVEKNIPLEKFLKTKRATHINLAQFTRTIPSIFNRSVDLVRLLTPSTWAHAYLVNLNAAKKFHDFFELYGITSYPDWPYPQPPGTKFYISKKQYFDQMDPGSSPTMTNERLKIPMENTDYSLSMPIRISKLLVRIRSLRGLNFRFSHILYQEIYLRFRVRLNRALRKSLVLLK